MSKLLSLQVFSGYSPRQQVGGFVANGSWGYQGFFWHPIAVNILDGELDRENIQETLPSWWDFDFSRPHLLITFPAQLSILYPLDGELIRACARYSLLVHLGLKSYLLLFNYFINFVHLYECEHLCWWLISLFFSFRLYTSPSLQNTKQKLALDICGYNISCNIQWM